MMAQDCPARVGHCRLTCRAVRAESCGAGEGMNGMLNRRGLGLSLLATPFISQRVRAEDSVIRTSKQYGLGYMSMMVMEHEHLVEKHAVMVWLQGVCLVCSVLGGLVPLIDVLLAGQIGFIGPGSTTLATLWHKTT